jgi:hypothetical protein
MLLRAFIPSEGSRSTKPLLGAGDETTSGRRYVRDLVLDAGVEGCTRRVSQGAESCRG